MAKSNKPIVWGPFAAGGTVSALLVPALILLTLPAALGHVPQGLTYESLHAFASQWLGKILIFVVIALTLWSAAHRLRITAFDFGVRSDSLIATLVYLAAAVATVILLIFLWRV
jgi:fumarate reductase subunit D